jgi:predicted transcriptional regulator YdeE
MKTTLQTEPIHVVGIEVRTNNKDAFREIPGHWQRFYQEDTLKKITERLSNDVYAVYTNFEHEGKSNEGTYSFIIGAKVKTPVRTPHGFISTVIPASKRAVFEVPTGHPEKVGEKWMEIWKLGDLDKSYVSDYEHYKETGEIEIHVGTR